MTFDPNARVNRRRPVTRNLSMRSLSYAVDGKERPYPVYHFSRRQFLERPNHNPFKGL